MSKTVFLSTVSNEFGFLRRRLSSLTQRTKKCQVRHQVDFFHRGMKAFLLLFEEIEASDLVVHLIGAEPGWCVPHGQATAFLDKHPEFGERFPKVVEQGRKGKLTATQLTAWRGLYLSKRLCGFQLFTATKAPWQARHPGRLNQCEQRPSVAEDGDEVVASLITVVELNRREHAIIS